MARRRINTKFLAISFVAIVGVVGAGVVAKKLLVHHDPRQYIAAGDLFAKQKEWTQAVGNYAHAAQLLPRDPKIWVTLGDTQMELRSVDRDQGIAAVQSWRRATEIDPNYLPAWTKLRGVYLEDLTGEEMMHRVDAGMFARTREVAQQCVRLDPVNPMSAGIPAELDIRMWLDNIPLPSLSGANSSLSDSQRVDKDIVQLSKIATSDPQYPFWVARAKLRQAEDALHNGQPSIAYARFDEVSKAFDASIAKHPDDAKLYLAQFSTLGQLIALDTRPTARKRYEKLRRDGMEKAQATIKSSDPLFPVVKTQFASLIAQTDPPQAEKIYRELIAKFPTNYALRVELASLLGSQPNRADDALAVLSQLPDEPPSTVTGNARLSMQRQLTDARLTRAAIRADELHKATTQAQRDKLNTQIDADVKSVAQRFMNDWRVLETIGKVQLQQGKVRDAIQTLQHASDKLKVQDPNRREVSLLLAQADAYRAGGQTSEAISLYNQALADPKAQASPLPHLRLAQLYLSQHDRADAAVHVNWLKQRFPYDVQVVSLEIGALDPSKDHAQIMKLYNGLPENDDGAILRKVQVAQQVGDTADIARLLNRVYNDHPEDPHIAFDLARADMAINQTAKAKQVLAESLKINPTFTPIKLLSEQLNGASIATREDTLEKSLASIKDPVVREQRMAQYADSVGKPDEAIDHLKKALAIAPKNASVAGDLFNHYLRAKEFKKAEPLLDTLAALDADQANGLVFKFNYTFAKGDIPGALGIGRQLTHDFPEFSGSWACLGQALEASGRDSDAATDYLAALDRQGTNYIALRHLVNCYYALNRIADASQYIAEGRKRFPNDAGFRQLEIEHMLNYGDPQDAVNTVLASLKSESDDRSAYLTAAQVCSRASAAMRAKGHPNIAMHNLEQARDVLHRAVQHWPDDPTFIVPYASSLNATGDFAGGEAVIKKFAAKPQWKNRPEISLALAHYYQSAGRPQQAEAPLREALRLSHDSPLVRNELVSSLASEGKFDAALTALKAEKPSSDVAQSKIQIMLDAGRNTEAESTARAAVSTYPKEGSLQNLLALSLLKQNKIDDAAKVVASALSSDDQNTGAHYVRAMVDLQKKPAITNQATKDLQFVLEREPGNAPAAIALAQLQANGGDIDSACHTLEAALRVSPQSKNMRLKLVGYYSLEVPPRWDDATRVVELGLAYSRDRNDPDLLRADADIWLHRNNGGNALNAIRTALKVAPGRPDLVRDYLSILLQTGNDAQVLDETQNLLNHPPVPWWVYTSRGTAMVHTGDNSGASGQFDLALTAAASSNSSATVGAVVSNLVHDLGLKKTIDLVLPRTKNSVTWKLQAVSLLSQDNQPKQALSMLDAAMGNLGGLPSAEQANALQLAGGLYLGNQPPAPKKAIDAYKKLLTIEPDNAVALNNLAYLLSEVVTPPQPRKALVYSQKAFDNVRAKGRIEPRIYDTQGWVLILDGRVDDGIDILQQIINKANFPDAHYHLAEGYLRKNLPLDAQRELLIAGDMLDKAEEQHKHADPDMKKKVDAALRQANAMQNAKPVAK